MVDRLLSPLNLPYMAVSQGETHHLPRYYRYPRLAAVGVQSTPDPEAEKIFKTLAARNALQMHAPAYAASVVKETDDPDRLRRAFKDLVKRTDPWPGKNSMQAMLPPIDLAARTGQPRPSQRVLLLTGSSKTRQSTSAALGSFLVDLLKGYACQTETLHLKANPQQEAQLLSAVDRADLVLLSFPLYNDAPPYAVIKTLQTIAAHRKAVPGARPQRLVAISNNGFPEAHHNIPALAICHQFSQESGMQWVGGLTMGAGEALCKGQPLAEIKRSLPPVKHVRQALEIAAAALAGGNPLSEHAARKIAANPLPLAPFWLWRMIFIRVAAGRWEKEAAENGVQKEWLLARPLV